MHQHQQLALLHGKEEQRRPDSSYYLEDRMERAGDGAAARAVKLVEVLTEENLRVAPMSDGRIKISGSSCRIDVMARCEELREAIEEWSDRK